MRRRLKLSWASLEVWRFDSDLIFYVIAIHYTRFNFFRDPVSKMLFGNIWSLAACIAAVCAAPIDLQRRQGPAGIPDYVLKYGE